MISDDDRFPGGSDRPSATLTALVPHARPVSRIEPNGSNRAETLHLPLIPVPVTWGGHRVNAPGFDQDRFERAMARAFVDDLRVGSLRGDAYLVHHPGASHGHRVTRETCSCPAGQHDVPCKHRAILIAHLDVRAPQLARQWAKRLRARQPAPARRAA